MKPAHNLLERLIAEAQADDYALAQRQGPTRRGSLLVAGGLFAVIGVLLVTAFLQRQTGQPSAQERRQGLVARIETVTADNLRAEQLAADLRASVSQLQRLATVGLGESFAEQLRAVEIASGFVGLAGPGAVVVMDDARPPLPAGVEPDEARVLDIDVQLAVNGLWQAGARAIAINDVRLTSTTAIRMAGEAILVDYRPLVPPYDIVAVGPDDLAGDFKQSAAWAELDELRRDYGIRSDVADRVRVEVPASTANLPNQAEVVKGDGR